MLCRGPNLFWKQIGKCGGNQIPSINHIRHPNGARRGKVGTDKISVCLKDKFVKKKFKKYLMAYYLKGPEKQMTYWLSSV